VLYTYFGQFIDHDLAFDPISTLIKHSDPDALTDFRTPAFDLDNVYGRGKDDQPYMYDDGPRFLLGDPRNDEETIASQLQGLFLRFHNRIIKDHPAIDPQADFSQIQKLVRFQYRTWCSMTFCRHHSLHRVERSENRRWKIRPAQASVLPLEGKVEFSVAAYRLGHSIIRPGYGLNDHDFTLLPIFPAPSQGLPEGLTGFRALLPHFGIDWGRFIDIFLRAPGDDNSAKSRRQKTAASSHTASLPPS
jgi:hypothetical protein